MGVPAPVVSGVEALIARETVTRRDLHRGVDSLALEVDSLEAGRDLEAAVEVEVVTGADVRPT